MKKPSRKIKLLCAGWPKPGIGRYIVGASLLLLGARAAQAADTITPEQWYEGGTNAYNNWIEFSTGALMTQGNANQAVQGQQLGTGAFGGIEDLHYETDVAKKTTLTLDGRSIFDQHDYSIGVGLTREDLGFVRVHFENFRTWDSANGGYLPDAHLSYSLPGNPLALDRGEVSFEAGLTKPDLPQITFKYSHWYRNGDESSTLWGPVHDPSSGNSYLVYPGIYAIDETSDTFQLDLTHHYKKINYGAGVSYQIGELNDTHKLTLYSQEPAQQRITDQQGTSYDMLSTHAFAESWIKDNLFLSTGFMFANLDDTISGSRIYGDEFGVAYSPSYPAADFGYYSLQGGAHEHQYILNVNLLSLPTKTFSISPSLRMQKEDWNANSTGIGTAYDPSASSGDQTDFAGSSWSDSIDVIERLDLRYTGCTNWVLNAGGEWTEGQGSLYENGGFTQVFYNNQGDYFGQPPVLFATDETRLFQKYYASARWYPAYRASLDFGGYYKINTYNYTFTQDNTPNDITTGLPVYPGFIVYQGMQTWDGNIRLTLHPLNRVTTVSRYEYQYSKIWTMPDSTPSLGETDSAKMTSHIIGQNVSWTPLNWLGLQAGFNYVLSATETPATYTQSVLNSLNNYWTVNFNSDFVLSDKTDLDIGYFYYYANDFQNPANGLALGAGGREHSVTASLTHRITQNLRLSLKYAFTHYEDMASGGNFNYDAHIIYSSLQYRF